MYLHWRSIVDETAGTQHKHLWILTEAVLVFGVSTTKETTLLNAVLPKEPWVVLTKLSMIILSSLSTEVLTKQGQLMKS